MYQTIMCTCGQQARIVETGVGTYIRCPYCGADTYMCTTKEEAIEKFEEKSKNVVYEKSYQEYKAELDEELQKTANGFVRIGYLLRIAQDTNILQESGYSNVNEFAQVEYGLDKSQVSRFIGINERFSQGGYSEQLMEQYRGFGVAKLAIMLQLPDTINQELSPEYSKAEINAIREEVKEEQIITPMEVLMEDTDTNLDDRNLLGRVLYQLGKENPGVFREMHEVISEELAAGKDLDASEERIISGVAEILAPSGEAIHMVRIAGEGRKMLSVKGTGTDLVVVDVRSSEKKSFTWKELAREAWDICHGMSLDEAWERTYGDPFPEETLQENAKVAPVQQKKASKVTKAKATPDETVENLSREEISQEEQLPGQMEVADYPELIPETEQEQNKIVQQAGDSADASNIRRGYIAAVKNNLNTLQRIWDGERNIPKMLEILEKLEWKLERIQKME